MRRKIVVVVKGYPRLSETFIAQELLGLEQAGLDLVIVALRRPTDKKRHPVHDEIRAPVLYLPEYLHEEPLRVLRSARRTPADGRLLAGARRLCRGPRAATPTRNRLRRFGQALVLAAEWPAGGEWLHAHFIHTPASATRYASLLTGIPWTCSAHAKDIWTSADRDLKGKLASARWTVTCTESGFAHLRRLAGEPRQGPSQPSRPRPRPLRTFCRRNVRSATAPTPARPVLILSVGRAVEKKGFDILLRGTGAGCRRTCTGASSISAAASCWGSCKRAGGRARHRRPHLVERRLGSRTSAGSATAQADLFALACRISADGDRDGLPNVLVEASSQRLPASRPRFPACRNCSADGENGLLVPPEDPAALAAALERAIRDPQLRSQAGRGGRAAGARPIRPPRQHPSADGPVRAGVADDADERPAVLFYVQHLLGIGHLARASRVAAALAEDGFAVTVVSGGTPVPGFPGPGVATLELPPILAADEGFSALTDAPATPIDDAYQGASPRPAARRAGRDQARHRRHRGLSVRAAADALRAAAADRGDRAP